MTNTTNAALLSDFVLPQRLISYITLCCFAVFMYILPFFVVTYIPATDLPQHLAQVKLYFQLLAQGQSELYEISFFNANVLVYWILAFLELLFPTLLAGKILMMLLVTSWVLSTFFLAHRTQRSPVVTLFASTLIYNTSFYWGFINFLIGYPFFIIWYLEITQQNEGQRYYPIVLFLLSITLFFAHALWFAFGLVVYSLIALYRKTPVRTSIKQSIGIVPVVIFALVWFPQLAASRTELAFDTNPYWIFSPLERLNPIWILNSLYGGIHSPMEWILFISIITWIVLSIVTNRQNLKLLINKELFLTSIILLGGVFFLPEKYINTIYFASRWLPVAVIFLLLSLPSPKVSMLVQFLSTILLVTMFSVLTMMTWRTHEQYENSGLTEALEALTENKKVVGLDFVKESQLIKGRPFMQTFAYAQALKNAELNFSFTMHQSGIVKIKSNSLKHYWTPGLEWFAERIRFEDFNYFNYALINAHDDLHQVFSLLPTLQPVTKHGRWRLYQCIPTSSFHGFVFQSIPQ